MAAIKAGFRAGDLVRVKTDSLKSSYDYKAQCDIIDDYVWGSYHSTETDTKEWYASQQVAVKEAMAKGEDPFHINRQSDGESRLPPLGGRAKIFANEGYRVLRARCRKSFSYHNPTGGWTKLLDLNTGREVYVKMTKLEKVSA